MASLQRSHRAFLRDAAGTLGLRSTFVVLELLCTLALARYFGATDYGAYAVALAWVGLLAIPAALGFDRLLVREVAAGCAVGAWGVAKGLVRRSTMLVVASSLVVAAAGALLATQFAPHGAVTTVQLSMLIVPLLAYARVRQAVLQGLGRVLAGQVPEMLVLPVTLLVLLGLLAAYGLEKSSLSAVALHAAAAASACVIGIIILRRSLPAQMRDSRAEYRGNEWLRSANPLVWMMAMNVVLTVGDTVLLGWLRDAREAGIYRVASQMAAFVAFPLTALNMAAAPRIAAMHARGDRSGLRAIVGSVSRLALLIGLPIACVLAGAGAHVLGLFGTAFAEGHLPLVILCAAYVVNAFAGSAGYVLIMTGYERDAARTFTIAAIVAVCANLLLIPRWGATGAAVGTALGLSCVSLGMRLQARQRLSALGEERLGGAG